MQGRTRLLPTGGADAARLQGSKGVEAGRAGGHQTAGTLVVDLQRSDPRLSRATGGDLEPESESERGGVPSGARDRAGDGIDAVSGDLGYRLGAAYRRRLAQRRRRRI